MTEARREGQRRFVGVDNLVKNWGTRMGHNVQAMKPFSKFPGRL